MRTDAKKALTSEPEEICQDKVKSSESQKEFLRIKNCRPKDTRKQKMERIPMESMGTQKQRQCEKVFIKNQKTL